MVKNDPVCEFVMNEAVAELVTNPNAVICEDPDTVPAGTLPPLPTEKSDPPIVIVVNAVPGDPPGFATTVVPLPPPPLDPDIDTPLTSKCPNDAVDAALPDILPECISTFPDDDTSNNGN